MVKIWVLAVSTKEDTSVTYTVCHLIVGKGLKFCNDYQMLKMLTPPEDMKMRWTFWFFWIISLTEPFKL